MLVANRISMFDNGCLPNGACPVEYLGSTGTQYVDTGIAVRETVRMEIEIAVTGTGSIQLCGTYAENARFQIGVINGRWSVGFGSVGLTGAVMDGLRHAFVLDGARRLATLDGERFGDLTQAVVSFGLNHRILLFARSNFGYNPWRVDSLFSGKMYRCRLFESGVLVRDFIPVRYNGIGYLYDGVAKQFFGNIGSGSFIVGPDI